MRLRDVELVENATDDALDIASISRYHHITNIQFDEIFAASTLQQRKPLRKNMVYKQVCQFPISFNENVIYSHRMILKLVKG